MNEMTMKKGMQKSYTFKINVHLTELKEYWLKLV